MQQRLNTTKHIRNHAWRQNLAAPTSHRSRCYRKYEKKLWRHEPALVRGGATRRRRALSGSGQHAFSHLPPFFFLSVAVRGDRKTRLSDLMPSFPLTEKQQRLRVNEARMKCVCRKHADRSSCLSARCGHPFTRSSPSSLTTDL